MPNRHRQRLTEHASRGQIEQVAENTDSAAQGIGFAIAIDDAKPIIEQLLQRRMVTRAYLGISVQTLTPTRAAMQNLAHLTISTRKLTIR